MSTVRPSRHTIQYLVEFSRPKNNLYLASLEEPSFLMLRITFSFSGYRSILDSNYRFKIPSEVYKRAKLSHQKTDIIPTQQPCFRFPLFSSV